MRKDNIECFAKILGMQQKIIPVKDEGFIPENFCSFHYLCPHFLFSKTNNAVRANCCNTTPFKFFFWVESGTGHTYDVKPLPLFHVKFIC